VACNGGCDDLQWVRSSIAFDLIRIKQRRTQKNALAGRAFLHFQISADVKLKYVKDELVSPVVTTSGWVVVVP
jgi:hypothetical protein